MKRGLNLVSLMTVVFVSSCGIIKEGSQNSTANWTFGKDLSLLNQYADCEVLGYDDSFIAISPKLQGRVLVGTLEGTSGTSLGWYNRDSLLSTSDTLKFSALGGLDSLSIIPEGGQYALFFPKDALFIAENWVTPAFLSQEAWDVKSKNASSIKLEKRAQFKNSKGFAFDALFEREISLINKTNASVILGIDIPDSISMLAFQSFNKITNKGNVAWDKNALLALSSQSYFTASKNCHAFIPYKDGDSLELGNILRDDYFESANEFQLAIFDNYVRLRTDAKKMIEVGINPKRSKGIVASYDAYNGILTVITYIQPASSKLYADNSWRNKDDPLLGDAMSVFNNGISNAGSFESTPYYKMSTNSPALALASEQSQFHVHRVFKFKGSEYELGLIAFKLIGVPIKDLRVE